MSGWFELYANCPYVVTPRIILACTVATAVPTHTGVPRGYSFIAFFPMHGTHNDVCGFTSTVVVLSKQVLTVC